MLQIIIELDEKAAEANLPGSGAATAEGGFGTFLSGLLSAIMALAAIMVLLYLIWGAIEWITSGGEKGKVETAREKITTSIVGLLVLAASTGLFIVMQQFLGICVLSIGGSC